MLGCSPARFALVAALVGVAVAGDVYAEPFVYVMGRQSGTPRRNVLTVIDAATNTKSTQIALGTANNFILPQLMVISPDGSRVYVGNDLESTISVVSTATNSVVDTWPATLVGASPRAMALSPDGSRMYVARQNGSLAAIDVPNRTILADLNPGLGSIFGIAASPDGTRVYALANPTYTLITLSASSFQVVSTLAFDLEATLLRNDIVVPSPSGHVVYVPQFSSISIGVGSCDTCVPITPPGDLGPSTQVVAVDTSSGAVAATTRVAPAPLQPGQWDFHKLYHLAVSPNGAVVYAAGSIPVNTPPAGQTQLYRLDSATHAVVNRVALNPTAVTKPIGRAIAFLADSSRAYVAASDGVYAVDTAGDAVAMLIPFAGATDGTPNAIVATPPPPPQPPSNLRATVNGNRVSLAWDAPSSGAVAGYVLEGGATPGSVLASIPTGQNTPGFTFDAPSGAFYIRIHAMGAGRRSAASNEIQILVNVPRPPSAPEALRGLANGSDLLLSWTNATTGGSPASLLLDVTGAITTSLALPVSESFAYSGVPPGTYTFSVRATNATGTSMASSPVTLTFPGTCPGAPQAPSNLTVVRQGAQLTVNWDPPSAGAAVSSYVLNVSGAVNLSLPMPGRTISGVVSPGTYQLSVQAVNPCGAGPASAVQSVTVS